MGEPPKKRTRPPRKKEPQSFPSLPATEATEQLHGTIALERSGGTTFTLTFPV